MLAAVPTKNRKKTEKQTTTTMQNQHEEEAQDQPFAISDTIHSIFGFLLILFGDF